MAVFGDDLRLLIPEVVQTSMMDCGPASLKAMLEGWGIPVSYGRLREACQTDVDGTSIDTLEDVGAQLGLVTEQIMVPADHLLLKSANTFPAIVVVMHPSGVTHFVIAWRKHGNFVQLMDPAIGRRWVSCHHFLNELYVHRLPVPAAGWREWAGSIEFLGPLRERLAQLRISSATQSRLIEQATSDSTWRGLAALDATTRMLAAIVRARGIKSGGQAARMLDALSQNAHHDGLTIPSSYWSVRPLPTDSDEEQLLLRGAVLVRVKGVRSVESDERPLSPELVAALNERPLRPMRELFRMFRADGVLMPLALLFALAVAAGGVIFESLLFRRLLEIGNELVLSRQRLGAAGFLLLFLVALLLLDLPLVSAAWNLGRRLEMRLRIAFLEKLPRLSDRYFHSRLTSDMAERAQSIHRLRMLPEVGSHLMRAVFTLVVTIVAIVWLSPSSRSLAIVAAAVIVAIPVLGNLFLSEYDLRARTHAGALSRYYLGALLGLVPIRTHSAERAVRLEHESLLVEWTRAARSVQKGVVAVEALQLFAGFGLAALLSYNYVMNESQIGAAVLIIFWGLSLPVIGQEVATLARYYPAFRNITLRLLEPMGAIEEENFGPHRTSQEDRTSEDRTSQEEGLAPAVGVSIVLREVNVLAAGHTILEDINLTIEPGAHVAIVGSSGAGKSSLFGLLLGWHRASQGEVLVDGHALEGSQLEELRRHTAWVDPSIQLWNRSLLENLRYGAGDNSMTSIGNVIDSADLDHTLQQLPDGFQAILGEGGALLSGGEGQRVRLGRAMLRPKISLVLLDESFRGLDRESRHRLLAHARKAWPEATLLCITHDISATRSFERVLVIDAGKIIEDGSPDELLRQTDSRYRDLLQAEESVRRGVWSGVAWRRMQLKDGQLHEALPQESVVKLGPSQYHLAVAGGSTIRAQNQ